MKAIQTIYRGPTNHKPRRVVAKADGVPPYVCSDPLPSADLHAIAAHALASRQGWLDHNTPNLIGGTLPDGSMAWVFNQKG